MNRQNKELIKDYITLSQKMQSFRATSFVNIHKSALIDNHARIRLKG